MKMLFVAFVKRVMCKLLIVVAHLMDVGWQEHR